MCPGVGGVAHGGLQQGLAKAELALQCLVLAPTLAGPFPLRDSVFSSVA